MCLMIFQNKKLNNSDRTKGKRTKLNLCFIIFKERLQTLSCEVTKVTLFIILKIKGLIAWIGHREAYKTQHMNC